ncbi:hypothetical protein PLEI_1594 [Photobacterium leiognathi lrivu.4.1]|uniref:Uncharacterized protein n=1 Tax=Photobacterium leiognathi lrivu.4.1 TaxID=1248232 RepID=A0A0U1P5W8_PHOLE|nr:hypothetical protein [Photobacterium leiognathi]GAD29940.1 hypothetical protein PLEI_1594 [Photobacterium leiognathi lrivu.4.1]
MKKLISISLLLLSTSSIASGIKAPFGLAWGMSKSDLTSAGVELSECSTDKGVERCQTLKPVKGVSFGQLYALFIDQEKGLHKVIMISQDITSDISGSKGKALYSKVKSSLDKKYGESKSYEYFGNKLYDEYDEFYQCLKYDGCGSWVSFWSPKDGGNAIAELKGLSRGHGFLRLAYESNTWSQIVDSMKKREQASDDDAL